MGCDVIWYIFREGLEECAASTSGYQMQSIILYNLIPEESNLHSHHSEN
jgi:hypothetical protein